MFVIDSMDVNCASPWQNTQDLVAAAAVVEGTDQGQKSVRDAEAGLDRVHGTGTLKNRYFVMLNCLVSSDFIRQLIILFHHVSLGDLDRDRNAVGQDLTREGDLLQRMTIVRSRRRRNAMRIQLNEIVQRTDLVKLRGNDRTAETVNPDRGTVSPGRGTGTRMKLIVRPHVNPHVAEVAHLAVAARRSQETEMMTGVRLQPIVTLTATIEGHRWNFKREDSEAALFLAIVLVARLYTNRIFRYG